jgi:putative membrane protein
MKVWASWLKACSAPMQRSMASSPALATGARELARGQEQLGNGLGALAQGGQQLGSGLLKLQDGAARLDTGLELLRQSLPVAVDAPGGSAQGLALSVQPVLRVVAPVPNQGAALVPNFVPLALWVGAVMAAFLVHWRRIPEPVARHPRLARAAGKLVLPLLAVLLQALVMWALLRGVLGVPAVQPAGLVATLMLASLAFFAFVFALLRTLGDVGRVVALLLLVVQVSGAGALLPIELSDAAWQALHPYLPLTWVVRALRATLFGAFEGQYLDALAVLAVLAAAGLLLGSTLGRWRAVPTAAWRPPLDID